MADFTASTIATLQPLLKRPTLKPPLLQKPPFRFLHDIVTNLIAQHQFPPPALWPAELLTSETCAEKEQRVLFFQRLIAFVSHAQKKTIDCAPAKILAGLEPEKTNVLLQELAEATKNAARIDVNGILAKLGVAGGAAAAPAPTADQAKPKPAPAAAPPAQAAAAPRPAGAPPAGAAAPPAGAAPKPAVAGAAAPPTAAGAAAPQPALAPAKPAAPPAQQAPVPAQNAAPRPAPPAAAAAAAAGGAPAGGGGAAPLKPTRKPIALTPAPGTPEEYFAVTARLLQPLIAKPALKPNLLQKPPFRFLHDIVTNLLVGPAPYPENYFSAAELDSAQFDTVDKKIAFLKRLIDIVQATTGINLSAVNPKKIVAGVEPENTNLMLQALARAAASGISATDAMKRIGGALTSAGAAPTQQPAPAPTAQPAPKPQQPPQQPPQQQQQQPPSQQSQRRQAEPQQQPAVSPATTGSAVPKLPLEGAVESQPAPSSTVIPVGRPMTARPGPPPRTNTHMVEEEAKTGAVNETGVIKDGAVEEEEPEEEDPSGAAGGGAGGGFGGILGAGAGMGPGQSNFMSLDHAHDDPLDADPSNHGKLTRAILEITGQAKPEKKAVAPTVLPPELRAIEELKEGVQRIGQHVAPVGKCMEYIHSDVEEMHSDVQRWRRMFNEYSERMELERRTTSSLLAPLQAQLEEAERAYVEQQKKIQALKANIVKNSQTIAQLLDAKTSSES